MAMAAVASSSSSTSPLLLVASAQYTSGISRVSSRLLLRSSLKPSSNRSFEACEVPYIGVSGGDCNGRRGGKNSKNCKVAVVVAGILPVDPWAPNTDTQSIASSLFAASLFPYLGFLYHIHKSETSPKLTLFGFYFLLAFVGATIPAGIYAKVHYGTSLSNVDWLHGGAESLLTLTNLFIVFGLRNALQKSSEAKDNAALQEEENVPLSK